MRSLSRPAYVYLLLLLTAVFSVGTLPLSAQNSGSILGAVVDSTGASIPNAIVTLRNTVSGFSREVKTDSVGHFQFGNLPPNTYSLTITAAGFTTAQQMADVHSVVPVNVPVTLQVSGGGTTIDVEAQPSLSSDAGLQTNIDRAAIDKLPLESPSSGLSSIITLSSPGVAADSDGQIHGMGDHASNTFSVDGENISDQQSKVFSNQLPSNAVQSLQVIAGAPPAEYGGKTSLVIEVTTRSGQGVKVPTGSVTTSYGSFGTANASVDLSYGGDKWGNFVELDGLNGGRFLDAPEFSTFHDKGNEVNFFDRVDRQVTPLDAIRLDVNLSRSWFQTPNTFDNLNVQNVVSGGTGVTPVFANVGNTDQRSKILTYNVAPTYTRTVSDFSVLNFGVYVRRDGYNYYPSNDPLADLGPIQNESITQDRSLTDAGVHTDFSYVRGINNVKVGAQYTQTFLRERDGLGIVNPTYNAPCVNVTGAGQPGFTSPAQCSNAGLFGNFAAAGGTFNPVLLPFDLTRGGTLFDFYGHTDVKELALYGQDQIKVQNWMFNVGLRFDRYNGLAKAYQVEPRLGISYTIKQTGTVLRTSYARTLESPFNENLVLSSEGCGNNVLAPLLECTPGVSTTLQPGFRNEFHAGLQQNFTRHLVFSGDYIWKYTHNAFDFSVLGNTPITFPIDWHNSKIPGFAVRADVPTVHGFSAFFVASSVAARFFPPQVAGAGATVGQSGYPFRIDHDEKFNQTTHAQYTLPFKRAPYLSVNWRYDSGLTATSAPCFNVTDPNSECRTDSILINGQPGINLTGYTADQQFEAGLACNGVKATAFSGFSQCLASQLTSSLLSIPTPGTEDDDRNPPRIRQRDLFDVSLGEDNLFGGKEKKWSIQLTAVNIANKEALYNYLSTFSGTHYVTPRALTAEVGFHF
jgi:hypothetical protein